MSNTFEFEVDERKSDKFPFIIVHSGPGLGKAQPLDCEIQTPNGPVKMGDVSVGDVVFGVDGKPQTILGVYDQGEQDTYKITFRDRTSTEANADHLWMVYTQKSFIVRMTTREIMERLPEVSRMSMRIPRSECVEYEERPLAVDPYIMGLYLSDGSGVGNIVQLTICDQDQDLIQNVRDRLPEKYELAANKAKGCYQCVIRMKDGERTRGDGFVNLISSYGVNVHSVDKFIPEDYLINSYENRLALLRGLMDGDGSSGRNRIALYSNSERLARDTARLVRSMGGIAVERPYVRKKKKGEREANGVEFAVNVRLDNDCPFLSVRKSEGWSQGKWPYNKNIESVEFVGRKEQRCIRVSNSDSLYLTDDFIVTHNSTLASQAPDPIFLQTEDAGGDLVLKTLKKGIFQSYDEVMAGLRYLYKNPDKYKTLVIDSLDHLDPLVMDHTLRQNNWSHISEGAYGLGYSKYDENWRAIINAVKKIVDDRKKTFVGIAHSQVRTVNDPTVEPYDAHEMKIHKRVLPLVKENADVIAFLNTPVVIDKKTGRAKGGTSVSMFTKPNAAYEAKTRFSDMPAMIPLTRDGGWAKFAQYIPALRDSGSAPEPQNVDSEKETEVENETKE